MYTQVPTVGNLIIEQWSMSSIKEQIIYSKKIKNHLHKGVHISTCYFLYDFPFLKLFAVGSATLAS